MLRLQQDGVGGHTLTGLEAISDLDTSSTWSTAPNAINYVTIEVVDETTPTILTRTFTAT